MSKFSKVKYSSAKFLNNLRLWFQSCWWTVCWRHNWSNISI